MNQELTLTRQFAVRLSSTRRGARLARLLAVEQLRSWELPLEDATSVIAELAANAAIHGRVPGRDFRLRIALYGDTLRIEVTDAKAERLPVPVRDSGDQESGRGLLLVEALSTRWGVRTEPAPGKTVWAEIAVSVARGAGRV